MKIVVIDGGTLNPGDLSWQALESCGAYEVYSNSTPEEIITRCRDAQAVLTNKAPISRAMLASLPELRYIGVTATGFNVVDVQAAAERGIVVTNVPTYGTASVAQMALALLLELTQRVGHHSQTVHEGRWSKAPGFSYWDYPLIELAGLTMGIVGCGRIGQATARLAAAFGMHVIGYRGLHRRTPGPEDVDLDTLLASSDVVSLHCPLTEETRGLINADRLACMKPGALLINTGRGPLIDEAALAAALASGHLGGAGLDVLSVEPPAGDQPLLRAPNCLITPHVAWASRAARQRLIAASAANVAAILAGDPIHVVNGL